MKSIKIALGVLACLLACRTLKATDHFAAPNGAATGDGSIDNPWDLDTALGSPSGSAPAAIQPGDTLWLRVGVYVPKTDNGFIAHLAGTNAAPIIVRNYQGEHVTLQCSTQAFALSAEGGYVWYWGMEFACTGAPRTTNATGGGNPLSYGIRTMAPGIKIINCIVHDTAQGLSGYNASSDSEFHGNISYYNGWQGSDRPHGHGVYMQNSVGTKLIEQNIVFDNFDMDMQLYGSGGAFITGITARNNTVMNAGSIGDNQYKYNLVLGGGQVNFGNVVDGNHFFFDPSADYGYLNFGQYTPSHDNAFTNNDVVGGFAALTSEGAKNVTVTGNKIYTRPTAGAEVRFAQSPGDTTAGSVWNQNRYWGNNIFVDAQYLVDANGNYTEANGSFSPFTTWQTNTGFDANSVFDPNPPKGKWIYVHANKFEAKRANVTIYNWDLSPTVSVDLSGVLSVGDSFVIQDAQYYFGPPIVQGTYAGGAVSIPMIGLAKAAPIGRNTPRHTAPLLGTFVVMQPGAGAAIPQPPAPPPSPAPIPVGTKLNPGDRVIVHDPGARLNVRTGPDATLTPIGSEADQTLGTVQSGPVIGGAYTFYVVKFDDGLQGYVVQDYLRTTTVPAPGPAPLPTPTPTPAPAPAPNPPPAPPPAAPVLISGGAKFNVGNRVIVHDPGARLNVRTGPDATLAPIGSEADQTLGTVQSGPVIGGAYTFYVVKFDDGLQGYVVQDYLRTTTVPAPGPAPLPTPTPTPAPAPAPNPPPAPPPAAPVLISGGAKFNVGNRVIVHDPGARLNVRTGPDATLAPIGSEADQTLGTVQSGPVIGGAYTFYVVKFDNGLQGYVVQDYLRATTVPAPGPAPLPTPTPTPAPAPAPNPPPAPPPAAPVLISGGAKFNVGNRVIVHDPGARLNVRTGPDATLTPIGSEADQTLGTVQSGPVIGGAYTFYVVKFDNGLQGYVVQDYLGIATPPASVPSPAPTQVPTAGGFAIGGQTQVRPNLGANLNVRANPNANLTPIGSEKPGNIGTILAGPISAGGYVFWQVQFTDGIMGWVVEYYILSSR